MVHCHKDIIKLAKMWAEMQDWASWTVSFHKHS
jgi:hypothetical protein